MVDQVIFQGDWKTLLPQIEAARAKNDIFEVILPRDEYERLDRGGLAELKKMVSEGAAELLQLFDEHGPNNEPVLLLLRYGCCP